MQTINQEQRRWFTARESGDFREPKRASPWRRLLSGAVVSIVATSTGVSETETEPEGPPVEELFQTELVYPQDRGEVQLTLLPSFSRGSEGRTFSFLAGAEYGITDAWQIGIEWNAFVHHSPSHGSSTSGPGDLELATRYSFMNVGDRPIHLALSFDLGFPVGDAERELGEGQLEYSPSLQFAWEIPECHGLTFHSQAGLAFAQRVQERDEEGTAAHEYFLGAGAVLPFDRFAFSLECSWQDNTWNHDGTEKALYLTPGAHWKPSEGWQIGAGISFGLNRDADDYQIALLFVREF